MAKYVTLADYAKGEPKEPEVEAREAPKMERPFVFINAAMSADGKISTIKGTQTRISSVNDLDRVDALRAESDAIMVGIGTVLADNPSLTVKSSRRREARQNAGKDENPWRVVVDSKARTPLDAEFLQKGEGKRLIAVSQQAILEDMAQLGKLAEILVCGTERVDLKRLLHELWLRGVRRVMVEGGARLNWSLLSEQLVDELDTYVGNMILGGETAPTLVAGAGFEDAAAGVKLELLDTELMGDGVVLRWRVLAKKGGDEEQHATT
jgi:2,5-diamino-6-(ribosylamino)-4(3H)-pyrimidinone 5'-phosphate reductase